MRRGGIGGHHSPVMKSGDWLTPPEIILELGPFDLDPCAAPYPRPWNTAKVHYTENGLKRNWFGFVWCNPPYGKNTGIWLNRLSTHGNGIALTFARTETSMFFDSIWSKANGILFLQSRLHFYDIHGIRAKHNSGGPSVLIAYGSEACRRLQSCKLGGKWIVLK